MGDPTLTDDEAALARYATALADAAGAVTGNWIRRCITTRAPDIDPQKVEHAAQSGAEAIDEELRALLTLDIAEQRTGPLDVFRRGVRFATAALADAGTEAVTRDDFAAANFAADIYDLSPASFAAIDATLHEPGLIWGAAKAHVHLRRRREQNDVMSDEPTNTERTIVALSTDLMDRSKIEAAFPTTTFVKSPAALVQAAVGADLVLVDLNRLNDPGSIISIEARVVAFGSHVDDSQLQAATDVGAEALPRSTFFRRLESGEL